MKNKTVTFSVMILLILGTACSKERQVEPSVKRGERRSISNNLNYTSQYPYNLNLIYFVPNDRVVNEYYEERLSDIFIETQKYFNKWMQHWGYGDVTFGILKDELKSRVKIHTIYGAKASAGYSRNAQAMVDEIEHYFIKNPNGKTSQHTMVIIPVNKKIVQESGSIESGSIGFTVPFRAKQRYGFAIDYPEFSLKHLNDYDTSLDDVNARSRYKIAGKYIGMLRYELGHAMNLIPNTMSNSYFMDKSEFPYPMMTHLQEKITTDLWNLPSYLTFFDATILAHSQLFSKQVRNFYLQTAVEFTSLGNIWDGKNDEFVLSGTFNSSVPVTHVTLRVRSEKDLIGSNSVTWTSQPDETGSFLFKISRGELSEYFEGKDGNASFEIIFHDIVGNITNKSYLLRSIDIRNNRGFEIKGS